MSLIKNQDLQKNAKAIALVDCNNFYASCERIFNPKLKDKPLVILSNNDGCVIARSNEAKAIGIKMGEPLHQCMHLIKKHQVQTLSSNFSLYGDISDRVMQTLSNFTNNIEIYSIDEAFLALKAIPENKLYSYGRRMHHTVKQWTGIPISVGIAPTKTLAKIASKISKDYSGYDGVFSTYSQKNLDHLLSYIKVEDIWGIGYRSADFLRRHYIHSALDLARAPDSWVRKHMSISGLRTVMELRGIPCIDLEDKPSSPKSIACSRSFTTSLSNFQSLRESIATFVSRAAEKLRKKNLSASFVYVSIRTNKFNKEEKQYANSIGIEINPTSSSTAELIKSACKGLEQIYKQGYKYKKAGIVLSGLIPSGSHQANFFNSKNQETSDSLMQTLDNINKRWGAGSIQYGSLGLESRLFGEQNHKSPRFTTQWTEIPIVNC